MVEGVGSRGLSMRWTSLEIIPFAGDLSQKESAAMLRMAVATDCKKLMKKSAMTDIATRFSTKWLCHGALNNCCKMRFSGRGAVSLGLKVTIRHSS